MKASYTGLFLLFLLPAVSISAVFTVSTSGFTFSPGSLTINQGDTVVFNLGPSHNAVEVTQATWNSNGNTSNGGFSLPFGGGTVVFPTTGNYYYVCAPHASMGMKGAITVETPSISIGSLSFSAICQGGTVSIPFTITGAYGSGNVFAAQLSDGSGSFSNPVQIGSTAGTASGQVSATIPLSTTAAAAYRVRVVSSSPAITGSQNSSDLTVVERPLASISPSGPFTACQIPGVLLTANSGAGLSYVWKRNGSTISNAIAVSYTATVSGLYTVETSNGTCTALSSGVSVTILPADPTLLTWTGAVSPDWSETGNWSNPCAVPTAGDTVIILATATVPASIPAISLSRLVLNNALGITLTNNMTITGSLALTAGTITLGNAELYLAPTAAITGGGANSFVITNGSGQLHQDALGSAGRTGTVLFPVGSNASSYTPVSLTNAGTADEFRVRVLDSVHTGGATGSAIASSVVGKTWLISEAAAGGSNATLTFQWTNSDESGGFNRSLCYVAHHDGSSWSAIQAAGSASGTNPYQRSASAVTTFSPFAIGDASSSLPVELTSFTAEAVGDKIRIAWRTVNETDVDGYELQRSGLADGPWSAIAFQSSNSDRKTGAEYSYEDAPPGSGGWYYRLRILEADGSSSYSGIVRMAFSSPFATSMTLDAYPSPVRLSGSTFATVSFSSRRSGNTSVALYNSFGQEVRHLFDGEFTQGRNYTVTLELGDLPAGMYFCRMQQGGESTQKALPVVK
jgi:plastocyanin